MRCCRERGGLKMAVWWLCSGGWSNDRNLDKRRKVRSVTGRRRRRRKNESRFFHSFHQIFWIGSRCYFCIFFSCALENETERYRQQWVVMATARVDGASRTFDHARFSIIFLLQMAVDEMSMAKLNCCLFFLSWIWFCLWPSTAIIRVRTMARCCWCERRRRSWSNFPLPGTQMGSFPFALPDLLHTKTI